MFNYNIQDPCNNSHCPVVFFSSEQVRFGRLCAKDTAAVLAWRSWQGAGFSGDHNGEEYIF